MTRTEHLAVPLPRAPGMDGWTLDLSDPDDAYFTDDPDTWQTRALCRQADPEAFFPEKGGSVIEAKRVCASCPVRPDCLEAALANDERFGIWGGLSERERRKLRHRPAR